jgi:CRP-like cAMP-binding protein
MVIVMKHRSQPRDVTYRLLAGIDPGVRSSILAGSRRRSLEPGQVLYRTGEPADRLFVLSKGSVRFARLGSTGREVVMAILGPGDVFGLVSLVVQQIEYMGTAESLERGEVLVWTRDVIQQLVEEHPQLSANVLRIALAYAAHFAERHERLLSRTAEQRLAHALMRLGSRTGTPSASGIDVRVNNEQLASLADVSPFTASRLLKDWERNGTVNKARGSVRIITPERLLLD